MFAWILRDTEGVGPPPYEVPAEFEFIDMIPRSALGKVLKHQLRDRKPTDPEPEKPNPVKPNKPKIKEAA